MFSWFSKEEKIIDKKEIDKEEIIESDNEIEEEDFLKCMMYEDDNVKFYASDARDFIPNIKLWSSQRSVNQNHINDLVNCLKKRNHFIGTFKIVRDKEKKMRLIDGQHRFLAIKKIMENDCTFNMNIVIELYETDNFDSEYTISLFKEANSCLNVSDADLPNIIANKVIKKLCDRFPNMIIEIIEGKRCNRPRINKRELYLKLKEYIHETHKTEDDVLKQILDKNNDYGLRGRQTFKQASVTMFEKCKETGLYLGLDLDFDWMNYIDW
jgi:hypothetical protein